MVAGREWHVKVFERTQSIFAGIFYARTLREQELKFGGEVRYEVAQGLGISGFPIIPLVGGVSARARLSER